MCNASASSLLVLHFKTSTVPEVLLLDLQKSYAFAKSLGLVSQDLNSKSKA